MELATQEFYRRNFTASADTGTTSNADAVVPTTAARRHIEGWATSVKLVCSAPTSVEYSKIGIKNAEMEQLVAETLEIPAFDMDTIDTRIGYATVISDAEIAYHFRDGREDKKTIQQKRQMLPQTGERK